MSRTFRDPPYLLCPPTSTAFPTNIPHQSGTFVAINEPTLAHKLKIQNPGFIFHVVHSVGLDECITAYT